MLAQSACPLSTAWIIPCSVSQRSPEEKHSVAKLLREIDVPECKIDDLDKDAALLHTIMLGSSTDQS